MARRDVTHSQSGGGEHNAPCWDLETQNAPRPNEAQWSSPLRLDTLEVRGSNFEP
jgi:hypothetical protein